MGIDHKIVGIPTKKKRDLPNMDQVSLFINPIT